MSLRIIYDSVILRAMRLLLNVNRISPTVFCMLAITQIYGLKQEKGFLTTYENGSILVLNARSGSVVITNGRITATEGNSVKLMPGTHIKAGSEMAVSIVSQEYQEALAEKVAAEQREKSKSLILKHQESYSPITKTAFAFCHHHGIPGSNSMLGQKKAGRALLPARTQSVPTAAIYIFHKSTCPLQNIQINSAFLTTPYSPILSWGNRAETIGVMLT